MSHVFKPFDAKDKSFLLEVFPPKYASEGSCLPRDLLSSTEWQSFCHSGVNAAVLNGTSFPANRFIEGAVGGCNDSFHF